MWGEPVPTLIAPHRVFDKKYAIMYLQARSEGENFLNIRKLADQMTKMGEIL